MKGRQGKSWMNSRVIKCRKTDGGWRRNEGLRLIIVKRSEH